MHLYSGINFYFSKAIYTEIHGIDSPTSRKSERIFLYITERNSIFFLSLNYRKLWRKKSASCFLRISLSFHGMKNTICLKKYIKTGDYLIQFQLNDISKIYYQKEGGGKGRGVKR